MLPIVFIHGFTGSRNNFLYLKNYFPHSTAFDLPGFGSAPKPKVRYDKDFFLAFLEKKIVKRSILVGHSLGAILSKDFALKYPELVERLFLISYPLQKDAHAMGLALKKAPIGRLFVKQDPLSKLLCVTKDFWKYLFLPFAYVFFHRHYLSIRDYFCHTYQSEDSTLHDTLLKDRSADLVKVKDKLVMIMGEKDRFVDYSLLPPYRHHIIRGMGHYFFGHEEEIATIIRRELGYKSVAGSL